MCYATVGCVSVCVVGEGGWCEQVIKKEQSCEGPHQSRAHTAELLLQLPSLHPLPLLLLCIEIDGKFIRSVFGLKVEEKI